MHYQNVRAAKFLDRPNRFIAHVELDGAVETVHVKNTGRCRELLIPGCTGGLHLVEVKGVTLETDGKALFPDAPTERGVRHIRELQRAAESGLDAALFFVVQIEDIQSIAPNDATHPAFGKALREAAAHGVRVLAYDCDVTPDSLCIRREVPVILQGANFI